jgi:hypothetical protein
MAQIIALLTLLSQFLHNQYASILLRLLTVIQIFTTVDATDPSVPTSAYQPAADIVLTSGFGQKQMAALPPATQAALRDGGAAAFMRMLDGYTQGK